MEGSYLPFTSADPLESSRDHPRGLGTNHVTSSTLHAATSSRSSTAYLSPASAEPMHQVKTGDR